MTAQQAIKHSLGHNEVVHLTYDATELDALLHETRDYAKGANNWQFWGEDERGNVWHVAMFFPGAI